MKFKIMESNLIQPIKFNGPDEFDEFLEKNCSKFLEETGGRKLYRGVRNPIGDTFIGTPRKNRRPKDTPKEIHDSLDDFFDQTFGWNARSEGLFTTGSRRFASTYGLVYEIYPLGEYRFLWAPKIRDLYIRIEEKFESSQHAFDKDPTEDEIYAFCDDVVSEYRDDNLEKAIESGNEIMIDCNKYIAKILGA